MLIGVGVLYRIPLLVIYMYMQALADGFPRFGRGELIFSAIVYLYMVSVPRSFLFLLVLGIGCIILLWHSPVLPYNYFALIAV